MPKEAAIGPNTAADITVLPDGRVLITPLRMIPVNEERAVSPESHAQTEEALRDHREGRAVNGLKSLDAAAAKRQGRR